MILEIKTVKRTHNKAYGNFITLGRDKARITIDESKNRTFNMFAETLLHELLHCYTTILRINGLRVTDRKEHKWIEDCEVAIANLMLKNFGRRK